MPAKKTTKPTPKKPVAKKPSKLSAARQAVSAKGKSVATSFIAALKSAGSAAKSAATSAVKKTKAKLTPAKKVTAKKTPAVSPKLRSTVTKVRSAMGAAVKSSTAKTPDVKAKTPSARPQTPDPKLTLIARDPRWLYAEWEGVKKSGPARLSLRIFRDNFSGFLIKEAQLKAGATHAFLPVAEGETTYVADLGYRDSRNQWVSLARSGAVTTPSEDFAPDSGAEFATIPQDVPFREVFEKVGAQVAQNVPLVEVVRKFRTLLPGFAITPAGSGWTPQKIRTLSRLAGARQIRRRIQSELSSMTASHILTEEEKFYIDEEIETGAESGANSASSPTGGWSGDLK